MESLRLVFPVIFVSDLEALGVGPPPRVVLGTLVAQQADLYETREQLRTLIEVYRNGEQRDRRTKR